MLGVHLGLAGGQPEFKRSRVNRGKSVEDLMSTFKKLFRIVGVLLALAGASALTMIGPMGPVLAGLGVTTAVTWVMAVGMAVGGVLLVVFAALAAYHLYLLWLWLWAHIGGFRLAFGLPRGNDYTSRQFAWRMATERLKDLVVELDNLSAKEFDLVCQLEGSFGVQQTEGFYSRRELLRQLSEAQRRWDLAYRRFRYYRDLAYAAGCFVFYYYRHYLDEQNLKILPVVGQPDRRMVVTEYRDGQPRFVATKV